MTAEPAEQSRKRPRLEQQTGGPEAVPYEIWLGILRERSETNLLFFNKLVPYIESNYIVFALGHLHRSIFSIRNDIPPHTFFGNLMFLPISMFDATRSPFYTYMYVSVPVPLKYHLPVCYLPKKGSDIIHVRARTKIKKKST